jgi:hypothetical protein
MIGDTGSEFAAEFELACQQKQLPLFVLPPKSPKLNAHDKLTWSEQSTRR